jgi:hypothetical protein
MDPIKALLAEMKTDEYVRFRYGKQIDAALKALDAQSQLDPKALEARLVDMLELVRGKKGGTPASPGSKSPRSAPKVKQAAHVGA